MIIPITAESEWQAVLRDLTLWTPPLLSTIVVAPHPDDETLASGGLIAFLTEIGVAVRVIAVTDGENAYAGESGLGPIRDREQAAALARLGVGPASITRLRFPDSGLSPLEAELATAMQTAFAGAGHVIAPWPHDFHPDHEVAGRAALAAAERLGIPVTFYFFWSWHRGTPDLLKPLSLLRFELSEAQQQAKREALAMHHSQLQHPGGEPILPDNLLSPAQRSYEVFLPA